MRKKSKYKRSLVIVLLIAFIFVLLFSSFYTAFEAGHDCTGDDCPICFSIEWCENLIRTLTGLTAACLAAILFIRFILSVGLPEFCRLCYATPIERKVRLNN